MSDSEPVEALLDQLRADQKQRWLTGDRRPVEAYISERPSLAADQELLLSFIYSEFCLRQELGDRADPAEFCHRFPQLAEQIELQFALDRDLAPFLPTAAWLDRQARLERRQEVATFPRTFGDYELLSELSHGGMGVVFRARQRSLGRPVALKMILRGRLASEMDVQRFYAEAKAIARLNNPGIVSVYEVGEHQGEHFISMELVEGQSLAARVADGPLSPHEAAQLMQEIAAAVHHAHCHGVIHRDLKPENVLLTAGGLPKVADFGLAKNFDSDEGLTRSGDVLGTPSYMSPEQATGQIVDPRTDVYALGAILFHLLTGSPPFVGGSHQAIIAKVIGLEPPPPTQFNSSVPRDLSIICLKCLAKNPGSRYQSALELSEDISRFLRHESILARPSGTSERLLRTLTLHRLDSKFRDWDMIAFGAAGVLFVSSIATVLSPFIGSLLFYLGMAGLFVRCFGTPSNQEWQLGIILTFNLLACLGINIVVFRSIFPQAGSNVWAPAAIINSMALISAGLLFDRLFLVHAIWFFLLGMGLSFLPSRWACLTYGLAWIIVLVQMGLYFRRLGHRN